MKTHSGLLNDARQTNLSRAITLVLLLSVALSLSSCSSARPPSYYEGHFAPPTRVTMLNGEYRDLSPRDGKARVVMFWASWCSRSKAESEELNALAQKFARDPRIEFITISIDKTENEDNLRSLIQSKHLSSLQHAFSGNDYYDEAFVSYAPEEIPFIVLIGPSGKMLRVSHRADEIEEAVYELLGRG